MAAINRGPPESPLLAFWGWIPRDGGDSGDPSGHTSTVGKFDHGRQVVLIADHDLVAGLLELWTAGALACDYRISPTPLSV